LASDDAGLSQIASKPVVLDKCGISGQFLETLLHEEVIAEFGLTEPGRGLVTGEILRRNTNVTMASGIPAETATCDYEAPNAIIIAHQRSGTHMLLSSLRSHSKIHGRGECVLRYKRSRRPGAHQPGPYIFKNDPDRLNISIVMYSEIKIFESLCGPITEFKVIHMIRDARRTAWSVAQMESDRKVLGTEFRAHCLMEGMPLPHASISEETVSGIEQRILAKRGQYEGILRNHDNYMTISYEEITHDRHVDMIAPEIALRVLSFLGLGYEPLIPKFRKTGSE
jgi:hypothetical protein